MSNGNDQLDSLIDRALASYTPGKSRPGLEQRVLSSLDSVIDECRPRRWNWRLIWTFAVAALLMIAVAVPFWLRHGHSGIAVARYHSVDHSSPSVPAVLAPYTPLTATALQPSQNPSRGPTKNPRLAPRQPTQQQLIAQLLANGPEAVASLATLAEEQEKPIDIKPLAADQLVIEPINITPIDNNPAASGGAS